MKKICNDDGVWKGGCEMGTSSRDRAREQLSMKKGEGSIV